MKTLECVGSEELINFLSNEELEFVGKIDETFITVKNRFFDFSEIKEFRKTKKIQLGAKRSLKFENCVFVGSLLFEDCEIHGITFSYCVFKKPDFTGQIPSNLQSLYFLNVSAYAIVICNCMFDCPVAISGGDISGVVFNTVTCPRLWLQNMNNGEATLSIRRFLGRKIYLPSHRSFKELHVEDLIVRQIEGRTTGWKIQVVDLS